MLVQDTEREPGELRVTESVGNLGEPASAHLDSRGPAPTEDDVLGPYYRAGAPYRAKISPPMAAGRTLSISGRVWSVRTRRAVPGCLLDLWQANADGHYDNEDPKHPPSAHSFVNRARTNTDERGYYEIETIYPGPYKMDATTWRSPHIHFIARAVGSKTLVTQLFFAGAPYLDTDPFVKKSLIIELKERASPGGIFLLGVFDIVLAGDIEEASRNAN
jgi:catechol 1,2-dioxygenase